MPANHLVLGSWNAICDVCGLKKKSYQLRPRWDGLMVCKEDYETRHEQDQIRIRPEVVAPPWVRPEQPDAFLQVCNIITSSAYADLATADCALADNTANTYAFLFALVDDITGLSVPAPAPAPAPPPPPPPPPSSPALKFNVSVDSDYLTLISVGGM